MKRSKFDLGFTTLELLLVIFIMVMLTAMTLPLFYQFVKTSKVQQTVKIVSASLYRARTEAIRTRKMVGVFFGDNPQNCTTTPTPGVLPAKGRIEVWTVMDDYSNGDTWDDAGGCGGGVAPYNNQGHFWYPYRFPDRCLTPAPITYPDGVRILAGQFQNNAAAPQYVFGWPTTVSVDYMANPDGEIKRHTIDFARQGAMPASRNGMFSWWELLIFDEATGEHAVMSCGEWLCTAKPRVLNVQLNGIYGPSGTYHAITKNSDIPKFVEQ